MNRKKQLLYVAGVVLLSIMVIVISRERSFFEISGTKSEDVISVELWRYGQSINIDKGDQIQ